MSFTLAQDIASVVAYVDATEAVDGAAAREALARRIDNADQFGEVRVAVMARYVLIAMRRRDPAYAEGRALQCVNKTLQGADAKAPDDKKRTQAEEIAWTTARSNFRHLLGRLGVKSKDAREGNKNAQRPAGQTAAPVVPAPDAPVSLSALSVPAAPSVAELDTVFGLLATFTGRVQAKNAKAFVGAKGSAYLHLVEHIQSEVKRIAALAEGEAPAAPAPRTTRGK